MIVFVPFRTTSGNKHLREGVRARIQRKKLERAAIVEALAPFTPLRGSVVVTMTRVSPRTHWGWQPLDEHDNLRSALKIPVDAVAAWLRKDDAELSWNFEQREGAWGVEIDVRKKS